MLFYQALAFTTHGKTFKKSYNNNKFIISAPIWIDEFDFLMDYILYQIFEIILSIF